jgi:hypothetical protein
MAARYGADTAVLDWRERLVRSRCGSRQVDMVVSGTHGIPIVWERPKSRRRPRDIGDPEFLDRRVPSARARIVQ